MEDIIKQIAQIDSVVVSNRENSEQALKAKRQQYEKEMLTYREECIKQANEKADQIYNQIIRSGEKDHRLEIEKNRKSATQARNRYLEIEEILLNEVFEELFKVEG